MKSSEIRIGNWFKFIGEELPTHILDNEIFQWDIDCWHYEINGGNLLSNIEPIKLTDELLVKIGFKRSGHSFALISRNGGVISIGESEYLPNKWQIMFNGEMLCNKFDYVHNLQNIVFLISNEELNSIL